MKVVHSKTPTEDVTFENVFWEPYEVVVEEGGCPIEDEIDTLQDAIICLIEDVTEHEDVLHMIWEKAQANEDVQRDMIMAMDDLQQACKMMLDVIITLNKESNRNTRLLCIILVRLTALTIRIGLTVL